MELTSKPFSIKQLSRLSWTGGCDFAPCPLVYFFSFFFFPPSPSWGFVREYL